MADKVRRQKERLVMHPGTIGCVRVNAKLYYRQIWLHKLPILG